MVIEGSLCYKHSKNAASVACQRCEKPICVQCMNSASVGFHCPSCLKSGSQKIYQGIGSIVGPKNSLTIALVSVLSAVFIAEFLFPNIINRSDWLLYGPAVQGGEWWRVATKAFVHSGLVHIGFNCYALWQIGEMLETSIGKVRLLCIYIGSLLSSSLLILLFNYESPVLGASGAIMGLAVALIFILNQKGIPLNQTPFFTSVIFMLILPIVVPRISFFGHLGGALGGLLIVAVLFELPSFSFLKVSKKIDVRLLLAFLICGILLLSSIWVGVIGGI